MTKIIYPFKEGDSYWTIEEIDGEYEDNYSFFQRGVNAIQSCWDDISEELYELDKSKEYFNSLEDVLVRARDEYDFIKVSCFDSEIYDIVDGDYFVSEDEDNGKFKKSWL